MFLSISIAIRSSDHVFSTSIYVSFSLPDRWSARTITTYIWSQVWLSFWVLYNPAPNVYLLVHHFDVRQVLQTLSVLVLFNGLSLPCVVSTGLRTDTQQLMRSVEKIDFDCTYERMLRAGSNYSSFIHSFFRSFFVLVWTLLPTQRRGYFCTWSHSMTHTHTYTPTLGRTLSDEWAARRRDLYLTTHNTRNRHPYRQQVSKPQSQQTSGHWDRPSVAVDSITSVYCQSLSRKTSAQRN